MGVDIVALKDVLDTNATDVEIFKFLSGDEWVFVSEDRKQLTRICEATELKAAGINAMYFGPFWGKYLLWDQAIWLVRRWQQLDKTQRGLVRGTVVEVKQNGKSMPVVL